MQVCITGGTGFLGSALARRLLNQKHLVRILARPSRRADEIATCGAQIVPGNLSDEGAIARAVRGADVVYHIAAKKGVAGAKSEFIETNVRGTERVLSACLQEGTGRIIYISSVAVYGLVPPGQRIEENTSYDNQIESRDFYAQTKILADRFAASFARQNNLPLTILRPGVIYGPGKPPPAGLLAFRLGKTDFVFGNPAHRIPLNFSENLLDAMQLAAADRRDGLSIFNIVDDENLTLAQFHAVRAQVEKSRVEFLPGWPVILSAPFAEAIGRAFPHANAGITSLQVRRALQDRWYDATHIRASLRWAPKVGLREALERSLAP